MEHLNRNPRLIQQAAEIISPCQQAANFDKVCIVVFLWSIQYFCSLCVGVCAPDKWQTRQCDVFSVLRTYRAFLDDPVEHDDRLCLLLPDHEPKVAAGVLEGALWTTNTHTHANTL